MSALEHGWTFATASAMVLATVYIAEDSTMRRNMPQLIASAEKLKSVCTGDETVYEQARAIKRARREEQDHLPVYLQKLSPHYETRRALGEARMEKLTADCTLVPESHRTLFYPNKAT
jgi:hypothetical protein